MPRRSVFSKQAPPGTPVSLPLILKLNNHDLLFDDRNPISAVTGSVGDALRLGCRGGRLHHLPGLVEQGDVRAVACEIAEEAKQCGLAVVVWSYPRGSGIS